MSTRINTNTTAEMAASNLSMNSDKVSQNIQRLSSGLRINSAADDAAGLVISESMQAQVTGLTQATANTNDAINVVKTAESALNQTQSLLMNVRQLVLHAANAGANDPTAAAADKAAISQAVDSIDRIAQTTQFNNKNLLAGAGTGTETTANAAQSLTFQIGANGGQTVSVSISDMRSVDLGKTTSGATYAGVGGTTSTFSSAHSLADLGTAGSAGTTGIDVSSTSTANASGDYAQQALAIVDKAISDVSTQRATLGAVQSNELQSNVTSLGTENQNIAASESTIRDTDLSSEIVDFTKNQILVQAGTSALAQANSAPQAILKLLG
jgi:flagellin